MFLTAIKWQRHPIIVKILFLFQIHSFQKILQTLPVSKEDEGKVFTAIQILLISYLECYGIFSIKRYKFVKLHRVIQINGIM